MLAYRAANWAGITTNVFFGCLRSYVFVALFVAQPEAAGYRLDDALRYTWLTQALLAYTNLWGWWDVAETIKTGQVATDLARPFDYFGFWLGHDVGRAVYHLLFRGVPIYLAGMILFGVGAPTSPLVWLAFVVSLFLAELVGFAFRFLLNLTAFWLLDVRGVGMVATIFTSFFSGMLLPIAFFPDWLRVISAWLPFQGMIYLPTSVFLGKLEGVNLLVALGQQVGWFTGLAVAGRALLGLATRRLDIQGG